MPSTWRLIVNDLNLRIISLPGVQPMIVEGDGPPPTLEILTAAPPAPADASPPQEPPPPEAPE
jgi:hypothetical protein